MAQDPPLTAAEKARLATLTARMCKRTAINHDIYIADLQRKFDRILDGARRRAEQAKK
jgi:hypothetical protein